MKAAVIFFCAMAAGCSYTPVADLRASGDKAQVYQRDVAECKDLAGQVTVTFVYQYQVMVDKCLEGRGHSVLNIY